MYGESLLYGLIIGLTGCSLCSYPLASISSNYKKSILYIFLSRGLAALIALPLIFLVFYAGLASSIIMLGIGTYGFMCALEGKKFSCRPESSLLASTLCMFEGAPAVLASSSIIEGIINAYLFSFGTIIPLLIMLKFNKKIDNNRFLLVLSGLLIIISMVHLYRFFGIILYGYVQ